jgi:hypothetical protein
MSEFAKKNGTSPKGILAVFGTPSSGSCRESSYESSNRSSGSDDHKDSGGGGGFSGGGASGRW